MQVVESVWMVQQRAMEALDSRQLLTSLVGMSGDVAGLSADNPPNLAIAGGG